MFEVVAYNGAGWENVVDVFAERGNAEAEARRLEKNARGNVGYFVRRAG
jgi:hypothetical protein